MYAIKIKILVHLQNSSRFPGVVHTQHYVHITAADFVRNFHMPRIIHLLLHANTQRETEINQAAPL